MFSWRLCLLAVRDFHTKPSQCLNPGPFRTTNSAETKGYRFSAQAGLAGRVSLSISKVLKGATKLIMSQRCLLFAVPTLNNAAHLVDKEGRFLHKLKALQGRCDVCQSSMKFEHNHASRPKVQQCTAAKAVKAPTDKIQNHLRRALKKKNAVIMWLIRTLVNSITTSSKAWQDLVWNEGGDSYSHPAGFEQNHAWCFKNTSICRDFSLLLSICGHLSNSKLTKLIDWHHSCLQMADDAHVSSAASLAESAWYQAAEGVSMSTKTSNK